MSIYSILCTRTKELSAHTANLVEYLNQLSVAGPSDLRKKVELCIGKESIFSSYSNAIKELDNSNKLKDDDIIIFCHDDIQPLLSPSQLTKLLTDELILTNEPRMGFVGPAGTTSLEKDAIWWNQDNWKAWKHRGMVYHGETLSKSTGTYYGSNGQVVVLDGLFLSIKYSTLKYISLDKPEYFNGLWDFYDIYYTYQAHTKKFVNKVINLPILHRSRGELVGRDSWHKNREAFIANNKLPMYI